MKLVTELAVGKDSVSRRIALQVLGALGASIVGDAWANEPSARTIDWPEYIPLIGAAPVSRQHLLSRAVVLGFSSASCGFRVRQDAHLQSLHQKAGDGLLVLGVSTDASDGEAMALSRRHGWSFPWTRAHQQLAALFDSRRSLPRTYLVSRAGLLLRAIPGEMLESDVLELQDIALRQA